MSDIVKRMMKQQLQMMTMMMKASAESATRIKSEMIRLQVCLKERLGQTEGTALERMDEVIEGVERMKVALETERRQRAELERENKRLRDKVERGAESTTRMEAEMIGLEECLKEQEECLKEQQGELDRMAAQNKSLREERLCNICLDASAAVVFDPCGHLCACANCSPAVSECPMCRRWIAKKIRAFM